MNERAHELNIDDSDDMVVVRLEGEIDQSNVPAIAEALREQCGDRPLVLDLSYATYFDSAGIAMLDALRNAVELRLVVKPDSIVFRALNITGLDQLVPTFDSVDRLERSQG